MLASRTSPTSSTASAPSSASPRAAIAQLLEGRRGLTHPDKEQLSPSLPGPHRPKCLQVNDGQETPMLNHVSIGVRDVAKAKRFYDAALKPLGYTCLSESPGSL